MKPLVCRGHTRPIPALSFSPLEADGQHFLLVSSCKDGTPMLRDGQTGDWMGSFIGHKGCCWAIKLSSSGQRAITGSADFSAKIWDASVGECLLTLPHDHIVRCVDMNGDGSWAVTGGHEKKLKLWDVEELLSSAGDSKEVPGTSCKQFLQDSGASAHDGVIKSVIWDERNNQIISAGEDKTVKFWDLNTMKCIHVIAVDSPITSMDKNHDANGTISLTYGKQVDFIDPQSRKISLSFELPYSPSAASLHPIWQDRFVTGSTADGWVRVHDAKTGEEKELYKGHHGPVHAISYSPDGELYASGSEDGTIRLLQTTLKTYGLWKYEGNGA